MLITYNFTVINLELIENNFKHFFKMIVETNTHQLQIIHKYFENIYSSLLELKNKSSLVCSFKQTIQSSVVRTSMYYVLFLNEKIKYYSMYSIT